MNRLIKLLTALLVLIGTTSFWGEVAANEVREEVRMPMEDISELRALLDMLRPDQVWLYLKDSTLQFGMECGELSLNGWYCSDRNGRIYKKEIDHSRDPFSEFQRKSRLRPFVWNTQGHLLTFNAVSAMEGAEYDLSPFENIKYISIETDEIERFSNIPETVKYVSLSISSDIDYNFFQDIPSAMVLALYEMGANQTIDFERFPIMENIEYLYVSNGENISGFEALGRKFPNLIGLQIRSLITSTESLSSLSALSKLEMLSLEAGTYDQPWQGGTEFLRSLTELRKLTIYGFGGVDPAIFSYNPKLERLSFYSSSTDLTSLPEFSNLQYLNPNTIESLEGIERISSLEVLDLGYQTVDLTPLQELPNLYWLNLSNGDYRTLEGLEGIDGLRYLNLTENPLESIDAITQMPELEVLIMAGFNPKNRQLTKLPDMTHLNNLRKVDIASIPISEIGPLPNPSQLEEFVVTTPGRGMGDLTPMPIKITNFTPSPNLDWFHCDECLRHEINAEIAPVIENNMREYNDRERAEKQALFSYRHDLYQVLRARWEEDENDNP